MRQRQRNLLDAIRSWIGLFEGHAILEGGDDDVFLPVACGLVDKGDNCGVEFVLDGKHGRNRDPIGGTSQVRETHWPSFGFSWQDTGVPIVKELSDMMRFLVMAGLMAALASCGPVTVTRSPSSGGESVDRPVREPVQRNSSPQTVADFRSVVRRVEPVAEQTCREMRPRTNCDFRIFIDERPNLQPNAYQTYDKDGRPVIAFTASLLTVMRNRDELAFVVGHEAAHHIEGHIAQTQTTGTAGALIGGLIGSLAGLDTAGIEAAQNIGGTVGARRFSKEFELEADSLGARITMRAGYDPLVGVQYFQRAPDPGDRFLGTHPPNNDRIAVVRRTVAAN